MKKVYIVALSLLLSCAVRAMKKKYEKKLSVFIQHRKNVPPFPLLIETVRKPGSQEIIEYSFGKFGVISRRRQAGQFLWSDELALETRSLPDDPTDPESLSLVLQQFQLNERKKTKLRNLLKHNEDVHEAIRQARVSGKKVTVKKDMAKAKLGEALQKNSHYKDTVIITQSETKK